MNSNSNAGTKSVLIENENKNNSDQKSYGSINKTTNDINVTNISDDSSKGWLSKASNGAYYVGAGAVTYGWSGLKWAVESTASVGTTVLSAGAEGVVRLKNRTTKDKNE